MTLETSHGSPPSDLAPLPAVPLPLTDRRMRFRAAFCDYYARHASMVGAVRHAIEQAGGTAKDRARPSEVARLLLRQEPVRARIVDLGGTVPPIAAKTPRRRKSATAVAAPSATFASMLAPDTAARLAAVAFDQAAPESVRTAAAEALRAALDAREAGA